MLAIMKPLVLVAALALILTGCISQAPTHSSVAKHTVTPKVIPTVPDLTGRRLDVATGIAGALGLSAVAKDMHGNNEDVAYQPALKVLSQTPAPGTTIGDLAAINVVVANPIMVKMPQIVGKSESDAEAALDSVKLGHEVTNDADDANPDYVVNKQSIPAGRSVSLGTVVALTVAPPRVVYRVTSNGGTAMITYSTGGSNQSQASGIRPPWAHSIAEDNSGFAFYYVSAQITGGTSVTCSIYDGATLISHNTSTGNYSIVTCSNG